MRRLPVLLLVVGLLLAAPIASAAPAGSSVARPADGPTIQQVTTFDRTPASAGSVEATIRYTIPRGVSQLDVTIHLGDWRGVEVVGTDGFIQTGADAFQWTGGESATIRLRLPLPGRVGEGRSLGVERADWAFLERDGLHTGVQWTYRGSSPTLVRSVAVAGDGYATPAMVYLGPFQSVGAGSGQDAVTVVVPAAADPAAPPASVAAFLARQQTRFDVGAHEPVTVFVLPNGSVADGGPLGLTSGRSVWIRQSAFGTGLVRNTPAHEFVHTRLGDVGDGDRIAWLREAGAVYYGALLTLNDGNTSFGDFRRAINTSDAQYGTGSVVLARPSTFANNDGEYTVGGRTVAALDAQIRRRSNGSATLADVFRGHVDPQTGFVHFASFDAFRGAVVRVSGDPTLGSWLDHYTTTTDRPPVPNDPALYVTDPSLDPDGDGLQSGTEVARGTNPFAADTDGDGVPDGTDPYPTDPSRPGTPTASTTPTPTATATAASSTPTVTATGPAGGPPTPASPGPAAPPLVVWSVVGLGVLAALTGGAAVVVTLARLSYRLTGYGGRAASVSARRLTFVAVAAAVLAVAILAVVGR